jgi:hypothetical protein
VPAPLRSLSAAGSAQASLRPRCPSRPNISSHDQPRGERNRDGSGRFLAGVLGSAATPETSWRPPSAPAGPNDHHSCPVAVQLVPGRRPRALAQPARLTQDARTSDVYIVDNKLEPGATTGRSRCWSGSAGYPERQPRPAGRETTTRKSDPSRSLAPASTNDQSPRRRRRRWLTLLLQVSAGQKQKPTDRGSLGDAAEARPPIRSRYGRREAPGSHGLADWPGFLPPPHRTVHAVLPHTALRRSSPPAFSVPSATPGWGVARRWFR